jgi:MFS family permease
VLRFTIANRRFLAFGLLAVALSGFGQTYFISLFGGELRNELDLSHGAFGSLYSAATLASGLLLFWAGSAVDRLDLRIMTAGVTGGVALGCLVMAAAHTVGQLVLAMFLLRFAGQGLMTHMGFTAMGRYFHAHRGKAVSVAGMGLPLGEAALPPVAVAAVAAWGWRATWTGSAVLLLAVLLPFLLWLLRGHNRRRQEAAASSKEGEAEGTSGGHQWTRREVLGDPRFYLLLPAVLAAPLVVTALFFHQAHLAEAKGWPLSWLATSFSAFAATHIAGLLVIGAWVDRLGARRLLPVFLIPMAGGLLTVAGLDHPWAAPLYLGLMGLTMGATGTLLGALWPELYGVAHLGAIRAVVQAAMVLSTAVSPAAAGWLLDAGVTMETIAGGLVGYLALATALALFACRIGARHRP